MNFAHAQAIQVPLTASELLKVQQAAEVSGLSVDGFVRAAVLDAATDPFRDALEQAAATISARPHSERIQHDYAS
jgi:uncharacterized protein (DUF1778 family)